MYTSRVLRPFHKFDINEQRPLLVHWGKDLQVRWSYFFNCTRPLHAHKLHNLVYFGLTPPSFDYWAIIFNPVFSTLVCRWACCRWCHSRRYVALLWTLPTHIHFLTFGSDWDFSPPCQWLQTMRLTFQVQHPNCNVKVIRDQKWRRLEWYLCFWAHSPISSWNKRRA